MDDQKMDRRNFLKISLTGSVALAVGAYPFEKVYPFNNPTLVSVVKVKNGNIDFAVEKAIDYLGGANQILSGKNRIMLKPNLVGPNPAATTKPEVIGALAKLMKKEGKEVCIGEGSTAAPGYNMKDGVTFRTKDPKILDPMQQFIFDRLGYTELAKALDVPLINLHSGDLVEVDVPDGLMFEKITLHRSVAQADLLCSVPIMKTHGLATVTLGMKNLIGVYPGSVYYSVRAFLHDLGAEKNSPGIAYEIVDMARVSKMGLTVIDATTAMEGNGPSNGQLVKMDLIIAGTNPLSTDMVAAHIMGFESEEIPTFEWAVSSGMKPTGLGDIQIRGEKIADVRRNFKKPQIRKWTEINKLWGFKEI